MPCCPKNHPTSPSSFSDQLDKPLDIVHCSASTGRWDLVPQDASSRHGFAPTSVCRDQHIASPRLCWASPYAATVHCIYSFNQERPHLTTDVIKILILMNLTLGDFLQNLSLLYSAKSTAHSLTSGTNME